jgi:hypothetical protein
LPRRRPATDNPIIEKGETVSFATGVPLGLDDPAAEYYSALAAAGIPEQELQEGNEAFARYLEVVGEAAIPAELQERALEAYRRYADLVERSWAPSERSQHAASAYRDYIRRLRQAWAAADEDALNATALAAIAQSMATVAWTASLCGQEPPSDEGELAAAFGTVQPAFGQEGD